MTFPVISTLISPSDSSQFNSKLPSIPSLPVSLPTHPSPPPHSLPHTPSLLLALSIAAARFETTTVPLYFIPYHSSRLPSLHTHTTLALSPTAQPPSSSHALLPRSPIILTKYSTHILSSGTFFLLLLSFPPSHLAPAKTTITDPLVVAHTS